jgi:hypothetical protein
MIDPSCEVIRSVDDCDPRAIGNIDQIGQLSAMINLGAAATGSGIVRMLDD